MAKDFYGKDVQKGYMISLDHVCKVEAVTTTDLLVVSINGFSILIPAKMCTLLDEEKLRAETTVKR